jgi:hypothetical protein
MFTAEPSAVERKNAHRGIAAIERYHQLCAHAFFVDDHAAGRVTRPVQLRVAHVLGVDRSFLTVCDGEILI